MEKLLRKLKVGYQGSKILFCFFYNFSVQLDSTCIQLVRFLGGMMPFINIIHHRCGIKKTFDF